MKPFSFLLAFVLIFSSSICYGSAFDDFLKDVLVETQNQVIGTNEYAFAPGDAVIKKDSFLVYYSGIELQGGVRTLLLTLVTSQGFSVPLKYPNPEVIRVKAYRLQVLGFDNNLLRVRVLEGA